MTLSLHRYSHFTTLQPSASEEAVHAEKFAEDPLKGKAKQASGGQSTVEQVKSAVDGVVDSIKKATGNK